MTVQNPVKIAILMIPALGDALLFLVLANNLRRSDYQVTFFSTPFSQYDLVISIPPIVDLYKNVIPADEFDKFCVKVIIPSFNYIPREFDTIF